MRPLPPVGVDVQWRAATHLRLEAGGGHRPAEAVRERQLRFGSRAFEGQFHRGDRGRRGQVIRQQRTDERDGAQQADRSIQQTLQSVDVEAGVVADRDGERVGAAVGGDVDDRSVGEGSGVLINDNPSEGRCGNDGVHQAVAVGIDGAERAGHHTVGILAGNRRTGARIAVVEDALHIAAEGGDRTEDRRHRRGPRHGGFPHRGLTDRRCGAGIRRAAHRGRADGPGWTFRGPAHRRRARRGVGGLLGLGRCRAGKRNGHRGPYPEGGGQHADTSDPKRGCGARFGTHDPMLRYPGGFRRIFVGGAPMNALKVSWQHPPTPGMAAPTGRSHRDIRSGACDRFRAAGGSRRAGTPAWPLRCGAREAPCPDRPT